MKTNNKETFLDSLISEKIGEKGTPDREEFERNSDAFILGIKIKEARKNAKMTQKELADKLNTKRSYISRIENDASNIKLSTLYRVIEQGLGGRVELSVSFN
jgi:DNA-binding XRE family transcriptional regulator